MTKSVTKNKKIVCVSGGFDPVHIGHLRMIEAAAQYGDVVVIVNSDAWLMRKKGYIFMPFEERCEILEAFKCVKRTTYVDDSPVENVPGVGPVTEALKRIKPDYFANGGDRKTNNTPEMEVCNTLGIKLLWNMGGDKIQSSSDLVTTSPMLGESAPAVDNVDIKPTKVEILYSSDVPRPSRK